MCTYFFHRSRTPQWFGIRDYGAAAQSAYSYDTSGGVTVAVPVAVPLSPQSVQVSASVRMCARVSLCACVAREASSRFLVPESQGGK